MTTRLASRGLIAALALALAACSSGGTSSSASSSASTSESTAASASSEASQSAGESTGARSSFGINGDPELSQRLQTALGSNGNVVSMRGDQFLAAGADQSMKDFLAGVGAQTSDMSIAFAATADGLTVYAMRILGTNESQLRDKFGATVGSGMGGTQETNVGGKKVLSITNPTTPSNFYLYFKDDTVYWMMGREAQAATILSKLP